MSAELRRILAREHRADTVRAKAHEREASRHRGLAWSGLGGEPFRRRSPGELNTAASAAFDALQAWRASRAGRLNAALVRTQALARAVHAASDSAQAAMSRNAEAPCPLTELRTLAAALLGVVDEALGLEQNRREWTATRGCRGNSANALSRANQIDPAGGSPR